MDSTEFDLFLFMAIAEIDEPAVFEDFSEFNLPLPTFDDIDDTEH